jgi:hypothetical protein
MLSSLPGAETRRTAHRGVSAMKISITYCVA